MKLIAGLITIWMLGVTSACVEHRKGQERDCCSNCNYQSKALIFPIDHSKSQGVQSQKAKSINKELLEKYKGVMESSGVERAAKANGYKNIDCVKQKLSVEIDKYGGLNILYRDSTAEVVNLMCQEIINCTDSSLNDEMPLLEGQKVSISHHFMVEPPMAEVYIKNK